MHIIATVGPKSSEKWILKEFISKGVDILRLNCSHFNEEEFLEVVRYSREIKSDIHIMTDLCGEKIRVSSELKDIYKIYNGEIVYFCGEDFYKNINIEQLKDMKLIPLTIKAQILLEESINNISMKDNTMNFEILEKKQGIIKAKVIRGGIVRSGKGCNVPNLKRNETFLSDKDKKDIKWSMEKNIDIICQSYVETKEDIEFLKAYIDNEFVDYKKPEIWAKVETPEGIKNLKDILTVTDNVVIGRGDLVPESGILKAVELEDKAIEYIVKNNKNIIVATNLLNSMKLGSRASLPEVESIYTFIKKGVGGFLLAGETSIGKAPIKTIDFLNNAIKYYKD
ncbi:pyruvate kinase [Clostridium chauvoei]|uniref:Pyruvate kinase n=2 Tax=Clostridium chauvoei TaxID=46867 RepID=S6FAU3_9CLOT|nr:pyruvate kinase [Clostridium chauvoei]ATD55466.1 pyruvate kinase [Clostridium chauvoei]ATD56862.1 pyruvate kinase [Clostridium chauvoei]MBX7280681.1 pyruvate kinase [Clostridium chauvoei]MBX7283165.1 pyruvate kinase [Clostridium chauvoei]MBX7285722.1 pyruvate kinase [Clostridium chauvoei]